MEVVRSSIKVTLDDGRQKMRAPFHDPVRLVRKILADLSCGKVSL